MNRSLSSMTLLTFHGISAPSSKRSPLIHSVRNPPGLFCQPSPRSVPELRLPPPLPATRPAPGPAPPTTHARHPPPSQHPAPFPTPPSAPPPTPPPPLPNTSPP